jgi:hypothetical protein
MPASRLSNISFRALKLTAGSEKRRYNWVTELNEELKTLNLSFLCTSVDEMDWIRWKSIILTSLESTLNQEDMARARDSRHHQYCANILEGHHVKDMFYTHMVQHPEFGPKRKAKSHRGRLLEHLDPCRAFGGGRRKRSA